MIYSNSEIILHREDGFIISEVIGTKITEANTVKKIFEKVIGDDMTKQELFLVMALDGAGKEIYTKVIFKGTINQSLVHPREIFSDAIRERARAVIIGHNHPSNTNSPSNADRRITKRVKECGELLGIDLIDHVITTPKGDYFSFSDEGLI